MNVGPALRPAQTPGACLARASFAHPWAARPCRRSSWSPLSEGARGAVHSAPGRKAANGRFAPQGAHAIGPPSTR